MAKRTAKIRAALDTFREALFKKLFRARFRYDVFISYSHRDAKKYAVNLKRQLGDLDFSCFIDEEESPPGSSLDPTLAKALQKSAVFVLVATARALTRPYIVSEFEKFASTKRTIIPINILGTLTENDGAALTRAPWNIVNQRKLVWIDEIDEAFAKENPSPTIADGIDKLFKYTRRKVRVRAEIMSASLVVLLAALGAGFAIKGKDAEIAEQNVKLVEQNSRLQDARSRTEAAVNQAQRQEGIANHAHDMAEAQLAIADQAKKDADHAKKEALKQQELVRTARAEANKQQRIAQDAALQTKRQLELNHRLVYASDMNLAQRSYELDDVTRVSQLMSTYVPDSNPPSQGDLRTFDWFYLWRLYNNEEKHLSGYQGPITFFPKSNALALSSDDGNLKLLDVLTQQEKILLKGFGQLYSFVFSPDGKLLITDSEEGVIKLWDLTADTPKDLLTIRDEDEAENRRALQLYRAPGIADIPAKFSRDGTLLAIPRRDTVTLWDTVERKERQPVRLGSSLYRTFVDLSPNARILLISRGTHFEFWDVSGSMPKELEILLQENSALDFFLPLFSPDGKKLVTRKLFADSLTLWDLSTHASVQLPLSGLRGDLFAAFTPQGDCLVLVDNRGTVVSWDLRTNNPPLPDMLRERETVYRVTLSPDGHTLAMLTQNGMVKLLSLAPSGVIQQEREIATEGLKEMKFSPDSRYFAGLSSGGTMKVWEVDDNSDWVTSKALSFSINSLEFSPDSKLLAAIGSDKNLKLWRLNSAQLSPVTYSTDFHIDSDALSPDNSTLAIASIQNRVWLLNAYKLKDAVPFRVLHDDRIFHLVFSPDGKTLVGGGYKGTVQLWNISRPDEDPKLLKAEGRPLKSVIFSFADNRIATVDDAGGVAIWGANKFETSITFKLPSPASAVAFSRDGKKLILKDDDGALNLWDIEQGNKLKVLATNIKLVDLSADGKVLVTVNSAGQVKLWDTGKLEAYKTSDLHSVDFNVIALSSDGKVLATGSKGLVKLRDIETGQELLTLPVREPRDMTSLAFSRDGKLLIAGTFNNRFTFWYAGR